MDLGRDIYVTKVKDSFIVQEDIIEEDETKVNIIGYCGALSTFGKFRGADFSDVDVIVFDEFINTSPINTLKNEFNLLANMIETVNRNRELKGEESVKVILLSNANTLDSGILRTLKLADVIYQMKVNKETVYVDEERDIYLALLNNKELRDVKSKTKLYRLTQGTQFYEMAIGNEFTQDYFGNVKKINYNEFTPIVSYDKIYFYKHKSKQLIFASYRKCDCDHYSIETVKAFKRNYGFMILTFMENGLVIFHNYNIKLDVQHIFQ